MSVRSRTVTHNKSSVAIEDQGKTTMTLEFTNSERAVWMIVPATSSWESPYNWHLDKPKCQEFQFTPGGKVQFTKALPNRFSSGVSPLGFHCQLRLGERSYWNYNANGPPPKGNPDLEAIVVGDAGTEDMWRTAVSAELNKDLWPTLSSTPLPIRLSLRLAKRTPFIGDWLWRTAVKWAIQSHTHVIGTLHTRRNSGVGSGS